MRLPIFSLQSSKKKTKREREKEYRIEKMRKFNRNMNSRVNNKSSPFFLIIIILIFKIKSNYQIFKTNLPKSGSLQKPPITLKIKLSSHFNYVLSSYLTKQNYRFSCPKSLENPNPLLVSQLFLFTIPLLPSTFSTLSILLPHFPLLVSFHIYIFMLILFRIFWC